MFTTPPQKRLDATAYPGDARVQHLAKVLSEEVERERANDRQTEEPLRGGLFSPNDYWYWSDSQPWHEFASRLEVLDRCAARLEITSEALAEAIHEKLAPPNWEVFFWMSHCLGAIDDRHKAQLLALAMAMEKKRRSERARRGAEMTNRPKDDAKGWVLAEYETCGHEFESKTKFAEHYQSQVKRRYGVDVTVKTITDRWLKGKAMPRR